MEEYDIADQKTMGFGSDGASVMAGEIGGVSALLKKDNPFCIFVHCVCHRLNLAVLQACKDNQHMATLQEILSGIYNYVQG
jgi:predicted ATPase